MTFSCWSAVKQQLTHWSPFWWWPCFLSLSRSLLHRLRELWGMFNKEMNTSVADYLSLLHLGLMLEHLAQIGSIYHISRLVWLLLLSIIMISCLWHCFVICLSLTIVIRFISQTFIGNLHQRQHLFLFSDHLTSPKCVEKWPIWYCS